MQLATLINVGSDDSFSVTVVLRDDCGEVITKRSSSVSTREDAIEVVAGLRRWARERGVTVVAA